MTAMEVIKALKKEEQSKACDWLTEIQRGNIVWHRYHLFGTITKRLLK